MLLLRTSSSPRSNCNLALTSVALALATAARCLLNGRLIGCLLDPEQQVTLLDLLSFGEVLRCLDEARHPRDNVDLVDRRYSTGCSRPFPLPAGSARE